MRTIAIVNQKGGCGKTTTAINLGACLGGLGRRTLLIDLDPQGHCAVGLGVPEERVDFDTNDFLLGSAHTGAQTGAEEQPEPEFWRAAAGLDLIPSRVRLAGLEAPASPFAQRRHREHSLAEALRGVADRFDVCLIDCPPSIGLLTFNALVAADLVLVPVETAYFSLQGASRQLKTVRAVSRRLETPIRCSVLPTLHEPGLAVASDLLEELKRQFGKRLLPVVVHRDAALREAASFGRPVREHAPFSQAARDYSSLASVLVETESLAAGALEEDWSDVEASTPPRRPGQAADSPRNDRPPHHAGPDSDPLHTASNHPAIAMPARFGSPPGASFTGDVVVRLDAHPVRTLPAHPRTPEPPRPADAGAGRAAELARRATAPRPSEQTDPGIPPRAARPVFGSTPTASGVEFVQPGALGRRVAVAGSFSGWQPIDLLHDAETGTHRTRLMLKPGRHEYRLIVDGTWTADPYNTDWILSEFGEPHSLVEVLAESVPQPSNDTCCGAD